MSSLRIRILRVCTLLVIFSTAATLRSEITIAILEAGGTRYENVVVRSVSAETVAFSHSKGLASIPLAQLPTEWQELFGYEPSLAAAAREARKQRSKEMQDRRNHSEVQSLRSASQKAGTIFDRVLPQLRSEPVLQKVVDLREQFFRAGIFTKDQGSRPSCSVFAVSSVLEFAFAANSAPMLLSEDYLIWATLTHLDRDVASHAASDGDGPIEDLGFSIPAVVAAAQRFGVAPLNAMPNTFGIGMREISTPPQSLINESQRSRAIEGAAVDVNAQPEKKIDALVHFLNAGWPVIVGVRWPHYKTLRVRPVLGAQTPVDESYHAITIVGYYSESGKPEDLQFIFRNSWGPRWGANGYGFASYSYLHKHILEMYVLDIVKKPL